MSPGGSGNAPRPHLEGALWSGYHSPQVEVAVRLNTNEAPEPPPPEFVAALAAAVGEVALNRYPDRRATRLREAIAELHGLGADQVFCANGSNEVIQSLLLAYGGPGRSCALFEPTYALHSHIARLTSTRVVEGERGPDYLIEPAEVDRVLAAAAATASGDGEPAVVFLCSPNNPTGLVEPDETVEAVLARAPGIVVVDEAYIQFARRSAVALLAGHDNLVVLRTYSKTWALAGLRLGYALGAPAIIEALFSAALPYHVDAVKQAAGTIALQFTAAMDGRVARLVAERARVLAGLAALGLAATPSESNFILFSTGDRDAHEVWEGLVARSVLVRDLSGWPRLAGHLARDDRHRRGERRLPRRARRRDRLRADPELRPATREAVSMAKKSTETTGRHRRAERHRKTKESDIAVELDLDGTGRVEVATGLPFFDHMLSQLGTHAGFDLLVRATGDLHVDAHHTVEDTGIALGEALAAAFGDKAGIRRFASVAVPLDEALVEVALDVSGRAYLDYRIGFAPDTPGLGTPPFDPQLAEEFWRAFVTAAALTLHVDSPHGKNTHHVLEASFKAVARALRDAKRVEGGAVPSTKGVL